MAENFTSFLSGGLIDTNAPDYAKIAKIDEKRRRGLINLGTSQINSIFGGGDAQFYGKPRDTKLSGAEWSAYKKSGKPFYTLGKSGKFVPYRPSAFKPNTGAQEGAKLGVQIGSIVPGAGNVVGASAGGLIGGLSSGDYTGAALSAGTGGAYPLMQSVFGWGDDPMSRRELTNRRLKKGLLFEAPETRSFEGFTDKFYNQRAQDYINYALPQLADQYRQTRSAIGFGLSNRGLQQSTVANEASSRLERETGRNRQTIADTGLEQANQLRRDVEASRQQALAQLQQTADPAGAVRSAVNSAMGFQRAPTFTPIANMFGNIAQQYVQNQLLNNAGGGLGSGLYSGGQQNYFGSV